nr:PREDICTED: uncharacterized protein LOC104143867 [Struthio camelus australis]
MGFRAAGSVIVLCIQDTPSLDDAASPACLPAPPACSACPLLAPRLGGGHDHKGHDQPPRPTSQPGHLVLWPSLYLPHAGAGCSFPPPDVLSLGADGTQAPWPPGPPCRETSRTVALGPPWTLATKTGQHDAIAPTCKSLSPASRLLRAHSPGPTWAPQAVALHSSSPRPRVSAPDEGSRPGGMDRRRSDALQHDGEAALAPCAPAGSRQPTLVREQACC